MNSRRRDLSEDPQIVRRRRSEDNADELLLNIPIDLVIEIFSRLPLKSIARCRCVSKRWGSLLRRPDFTGLFFTRSSARPQLLFACKDESGVIFFSTPQSHHQDPSTIAAVNYHVSFPAKSHSYEISSPVNGLVCISDDRILKRRKTGELASVICNPSTRQSFTLPKIKIRKGIVRKSFLGYDPVEKQHKVLALIRRDDKLVEHQVLTLRGTRNLTWRTAECDLPYFATRHHCVCINGVLYYIAKVSNGDYMIVCFDVKSEKYSFVRFVERGMLPATVKLINFQGKLASLMAQPDPYAISGTSASLEMWILEDPEKHEWSKRIFNLPHNWKYTAGGKYLFFQGATATNEFVFTVYLPSDPFHVYYYNFVKKAITTVEIRGMGGAPFSHSVVRIFTNYVEDVKLL